MHLEPVFSPNPSEMLENTEGIFIEKFWKTDTVEPVSFRDIL